ncbi:MAG: DUF2878 domain-containing protein [Acidobacteriota bacterium]|nr:DUF2878 domain-containing protein [Acidobacteriota bacterium]
MTPAGSTKSSVVNVMTYQIGWFACVLGAAGEWETVGASIAIALAFAHVALAERPEREWPLMLAAVGIGVVADTLHAGFGILDFRGHEAGTLAPLWIIALWLQFGTVLHFCMRWLSGRYVLASILGLVGGPMAFLGGERLGAATFGEPRALSLAVLGLSWALALPALVMIADRLGVVGRYKIFPRVAGAEARG